MCLISFIQEWLIVLLAVSMLNKLSSNKTPKILGYVYDWLTKSCIDSFPETTLCSSGAMAQFAKTVFTVAF